MADPKITLSAVDQTKAAFASVARNFDALERRVEAISAPFAKLSGVFAGLTAVGAVVALKDAADAADNLSKLSQRVGVSVESLSTLRFAAELADVELQALGDGLRKLGVNMADAQRGTGEAVDAFKALGINVESSRGNLKLTEDVLLEIAERFAGFAGGANKTALAVKLFGDAGAELIPFLNQGRDGIEALRKEAERLGLQISGSTASAAEQFNDNLTALGRSVTALAQEVAHSFLPALVQITEQMRLGAQQGGIWQGALEGLRTAFAQLFNQSTVAGAGATIDSINKAIVDQILLIERLENTPARRGTRSAIEGVRERQIAAAKQELERLKQEAIKVQELLQFETPGGLNPGGKPNAPGLPNQEAIRAAERERTRLRKLEADEWVKFIDEQIERERQLGEFAHKAAVDRAKEDEELRRQGIEGWIRYADAVFAAADEENLAMARIADEANKANDAARELGLTFASAFEDAIVQGRKFGDVLKAIGEDIVRILARKAITEPLAKGLLGDGKHPGVLSGLIESVKKIFSFADGGVMTSSGPLPLHRYAVGGIASGPQLALFGEGSMNEAIVPLPDGRAIPVKMQGGSGTVVQIVDQRRGGDAPVVSQSSTADGRRLIRVLIRDELKGAMADGSMDRLLASTFGMRRRPA